VPIVTENAAHGACLPGFHPHIKVAQAGSDSGEFREPALNVRVCTRSLPGLSTHFQAAFSNASRCMNGCCDQIAGMRTNRTHQRQAQGIMARAVGRH